MQKTCEKLQIDNMTIGHYYRYEEVCYVLHNVWCKEQVGDQGYAGNNFVASTGSKGPIPEDKMKENKD